MFRKCFVIPYGSVSNANGIAGKKTSLNSITTGDGRLCIILPDENAGIIAGKCLATVYNEDPGKNPVNSVIHESSLQLNASDMLDLLNSGVLLLRREKVMGGEVYRILLGVTTNCKTDKADKLIMSRNIVDELLTRIGREGQPFVKDKETQNNEVMLQSVVDAIVDEFARNDDIYREGTSLTVGGDGEKFTLNGIIKPVHSAYGIEVNTTIQ